MKESKKEFLTLLGVNLFCCGNEINCGRSPRSCPIVQKARDEYNPLRKEKFLITDIRGITMIINSARILGIVENKSLEKLFETFSSKEGKSYEKIGSNFLHTNDNGFYLITGIQGNQNKYSKNLIDISLKFIEDPQFYYNFNSPLIIVGTKLTILIAPRIEED